MPRLFTALEVPASIATRISFLQSGLPDARWIDQASLHITLRFIGDVDNPTANELALSLERVKSEPFKIRLENLDVFGGSKPHSLFARVAGTQALSRLQLEHERICQNIGLPPEGRKYTPHVTIARVRGTKKVDILKYLSNNGSFRSQEFEVSRFALFSARNSVGGGPYVLEESYKLEERKPIHAR